MKFLISMKTPDALDQAIDNVDDWGLPEGLDDSEYSFLLEEKKEAVREFARKWMNYGEYITVQFDTDAGTATVLPA